MAKQKNKTESEGRIINIMADGRIVEDLTGHVIPVTPETEMAYQIMAQVAEKLYIIYKIVPFWHLA